MSVYNRKLFFNRGGQVKARGTGITSGLVQPVQKFDNGGQVIDPMNQYRQAVFAGLMSGRSRSPGPVGSFLDILGQSMTAANPLLPTKDTTADEDDYFWAYNTATKTYDRVTDETFKAGVHTKEEPKEPDTSKDKKDFAEVDILLKDDEGAFTIPSKGFRFANETDESINHVGMAGNTLNAGDFIYASDLETEKNRWKLDNDFKVTMKDGSGEKTVTRTWDKISNQFKFLDQDNNEIDGALFDFVDDPDKGIDARWKSKRVDLVNKEDPTKIVQAIRSYNELNKNFVYEDLEGGAIDMSLYNEKETPEEVKEQTSKSQVEGTITFKGEKPKKADFIQQGNNIFYLSKGEAGTTIGQPILLSELKDQIEDYDLIPTVQKTVPDINDIMAEMEAEKSLAAKYELAQKILPVYVEKGIGANKKLADYKTYLDLAENATSGSFASERNSFMRLLDTIGYKDFDADGYSRIADALGAGGVASTEVVNAFFKNNVLLDALGWSQQLNRSELGLLFDVNPEISLTKAGQNLLAEANIANTEIQREIATYINQNLATKDYLKLYTEVIEMEQKLYEDFLNRPKIDQALERVKQYEQIGDTKFFKNQGSQEIDDFGTVVDLSAANRDNRIVFAGYPNPETGIFIAADGQEIDFSLTPNKPVYYIKPTQEEWNAGNGTGKIQAGIKQF
jgi:hypothetical protein